MVDNYEWFAPIIKVLEAKEDSYLLAMQRAGVYKLNGNLNPSAVRKILRFIKKPLDAIQFLGQVGELTGKVAGHNVRVAGGEKGKELAFNVRNNTGTPAYYRKGFWTKTVNFVWPFSNIALQGWASTYDTAVEPTTRSGYWFRTAKILALNLMIKVICSGMFGILAYLAGKEVADKISKAYNKITPYIRRNYLTIPLGWGEDGSPLMMTFPMDESHRLLWGTMDSMIDAAYEKDPEMLGDTARYVWDQLPSGNPLYQVGSAFFGYYALNRNPNDEHRGIPIMPDLVAQAGGWDAFEKLFQYSTNEFGLTQLQTFDSTGKNWYQKWTSIDPTLGKVAGRIIRYGGTGDIIKSRREAARIDKENAKLYLSLSSVIPDFGNFKREKNRIEMFAKIVRDREKKGENIEELLKQYPLAQWDGVMRSTLNGLMEQARGIKTLEADTTMDPVERDTNIQMLKTAMKTEIEETLKIVKGNVQAPVGELPSEFTNPPNIE
jgi:hypothetical protein